MAHIIDQIPELEREEFNRIGYTIGGMMIFPANQRRSQADDQRCAWIRREDRGPGSI